MSFKYSYHWKKKRKYRKEITDDLIEYCIFKSDKIKDKYWEDAFNAIAKIQSSGRTLKVVYKIKDKNIKILTAYWID